MRQVLAMLLTLAGLAACTATIKPPEAKVVVPAVAVIEPKPVVVVPAISRSPGFCPPGQAKKGNC